MKALLSAAFADFRQLSTRPLEGTETTLRIAALGILFTLAACGGGGGDGAGSVGGPVSGPAPSPAPAPVPSPGPSPPPVPTPAPSPPSPSAVPQAPTATLLATQNSAAALVQDALQRSRDLRLANGLTAGAQAGATGNGLGVSSLSRMRRLAAIDYTSSLCSTGRATLTIPDAVLDRFTANPTTAQMQPGDTIGLNSVNCIVKASVGLGAIEIGSFGVGDRTDGSFEFKLLQLQSNDALFQLTYSSFIYQPFGGPAFDPLDAVLRFGTENALPVYTLEIADTRFLAAPQVSTSQNLVFIALGSLRGRVPAAAGAGFADYSYSNWSFDSNAVQARSGSVNVTGASATSARITAGSTGYVVQLTSGGVSQTFSIPQ